MIVVEDLTKIYKQADFEVIALKQLNLEIAEHEFVAIMGPSGSGKTTFINLLGGLDRPTAGRIKVVENELSTMDWNELAKFRRDNIGFVFQSGNINPILNVRENIELAYYIRNNNKNHFNEELASVLELTNMTHRKEHRFTQLSAGERQRASIAMALIGNPPLLILDEPTGNLDYESAQKIVEVLQEINKTSGTTIILITHNPLIARSAERTVYMFNGHISKITENIDPSPYLRDNIADNTGNKLPTILSSYTTKVIKPCNCKNQSHSNEYDDQLSLEVVICKKCRNIKLLMNEEISK